MTSHSTEFEPIKHNRSPGFIPISKRPAANSSTWFFLYKPNIVNYPNNNCIYSVYNVIFRIDLIFKIQKCNSPFLMDGHYCFSFWILFRSLVDQISNVHEFQRFIFSTFVVTWFWNNRSSCPGNYLIFKVMYNNILYILL